MNELQIEDTALKQLRRQVLDAYGKQGEESVTEAWDSMQKLVRNLCYVLCTNKEGTSPTSRCMPEYSDSTKCRKFLGHSLEIRGYLE